MQTVTTQTAPKKQPLAPEVEEAIFLNIPLADIDESPSNPRKTFKAVDELAEDIKRHGLIEPVMVRPSPLKNAGIGRYELVFGARRFRASKLAGVKDILARVRHLSDADVLELQIVENSQRKDIHPLEEGDGYRVLHEKHGWSVEDIAAKVGQSAATVRARLKLCGIAPAVREAVYADKLTLGAALQLARIPHVDIQAKALKDVLTQWRKEDGPIPAKDVIYQVRDKFLLRLDIAPFDVADAKLVAGAPACAACPKRTGNQGALFGDVEKDENDLCTDKVCFDGKKDQSWKNREAEAKQKGQKILSAKEASGLFQYGKVSSGEYVDLAATNYADPKMRTNKALLGKKADVPIVVMRDPETGAARELVAKTDFKKAAKAAGVALPSGKVSQYSSGDAHNKAYREKQAKEREAFEAELVDLVDAVEAKSVSPDLFWKTFAGSLARIVWEEKRRATCKRRGIATDAKGQDSAKQLLRYIDNLSVEQLKGLAVELAVTSDMTDGFKAFRYAYSLLAAKPTKAKAAAKKPLATKKKTAARGKR